jgi:2-(1,2-epoxy-1,2-dihydrophenyl)acetyl-CoA isomerase
MENIEDAPILTEMRGATLLVTLNRPKQRNALADSMRTAIAAVIEHARDDEAVKAVVLTGAGANFCAGGDLSQIRSDRPIFETRERIRKLHRWFTELCNLEKPVVAAVEGSAFGAGMNLALACDFVFASPQAKLCAVFGRIGLVPDLGGLILLPRMVGLQRAKEIVFSARVIDAEEARSLGMVYEIVESEKLLESALAFAARFHDASTQALGLAKGILNQSFNLDARALLEMEAMAQALAVNTDYHKQAVDRFMDKKPLLFAWESMGKAARDDRG